ncbi:MAG: hypothetical protein WB611_00820 [Stellaceae bacterium]
MSELLGPPFHADHLESLLRPTELVRARGEHQAGGMSGAELRRVKAQKMAIPEQPAARPRVSPL